MESRNARFRFRMVNPTSPRQRQKLHSDRGPPPNKHGHTSMADIGRGGGRPNVPVKFVRNPKHPKNLYTAEVSIRRIVQGKPVKITPGMSFPDPKKGKTIRNPKAPRFLHEFDPLEEDYNIIKNPLAVATGESSVHAMMPDREYAHINDSGESSENSQDSDTRLSIEEDDTLISDDDVIDISSALVLRQEEESAAMYSQVRREGHLVRETPPMMDSEVPQFEPQPPPPKAPTAILVIPRAVVREDESHRNRHRGTASGEDAHNGDREL